MYRIPDNKVKGPPVGPDSGEGNDTLVMPGDDLGFSCWLCILVDLFLATL